MSLALPTLDDRRYADLMEEALRLIPVYDQEWTDHNASDPGVALLELFAYLTEMLLYRLDRVTAENQRKFLKLLNGPDWPESDDLKADIRDAVRAVRERGRAVTAADYERLATGDFNRWLAALTLGEGGGASAAGLDEWWRITGLDCTGENNLPCWVPPTARAACVISRNLDRGTEAARAEHAPAHLSLIVLPRRVAGDEDDVRKEGAWSPAGVLADARNGHTSTLLPSGEVLVVAGAVDGGPLTTAERRDPASDSWSAAGTLAAARNGHTATRLRGGNVLIAGGSGGASPLADAERYDARSGAWSPGGALAVARTDHTATLLRSGKVLAVGGTSGDGALASAELYDPDKDTWSEGGALAGARADHTATLLSTGQVLVVGGAAGDGTLASTERYDPRSGTWSAGASVANARSRHTAILLASGGVLVVGGIGDGGAPAGAELYDPVADTWSSAAAPAIARADHTATLLSGGEVLIAGGIAAGGALASAELYDPAADTWSATGTLATARSGHTATLLPSGELLISGGADAGVALAGAELYRSRSGSDAGAPQPTSAQQAALGGWLDERRMLTTRLHVVGPRYAPIGAEMVIAAAAGADTESLAGQVVTKLNAFLDPIAGAGWPFGRDVYVSELYERIETVEGVDYIGDLMLFNATGAMPDGQCFPPDARTAVAVPIRHAEGDPVGLALGAHHLPLACLDAGAIVVVPSARFVPAVLCVLLNPAEGVDAAGLKSSVKDAVRAFFHPLHDGPGPDAAIGTDLMLEDLQDVLVDIPGVEDAVPELPPGLQPDPSRLLPGAEGKVVGLRIEAGEVVDWRVEILVQATAGDGP